MDEFSLIIFNDDNHAEKVFINGQYAGVLESCDLDDIIKTVINEAKDLNDSYKFHYTPVYICDDFDDEDDELVDEIWDFFNNCGQMTEDQIEAIENRDWEKLRGLI